jgi:putative transposase
MRGPQPPAVTLSDEERQELDTLIRRHTTPQQIAQRARIVVQAADGHTNGQIARDLGLDVDTVRLWRMRWIGMQAASLDDLSVWDRLTDAPRPGRRATITPDLSFFTIHPNIVHGSIRSKSGSVFSSGTF